MEGITLTNFKTHCYKATVIKTMGTRRSVWIDQWTRTKSPEIDLDNYSQLIFDKSAKKQERKNGLFNKWC